MRQFRNLTLAALFIATPALAQQQAASAEASSSSSGAIHSLRQTLSSDTYSGILKSLVTPATLQNPVAVCAQCHAGEDVARFNTVLGPMLQMVNPVNWVNPTAYWNMAVPLVDPKTYTEWYNAYVKKYGGLLGYDGSSSSPETGAVAPADGAEAPAQ